MKAVIICVALVATAAVGGTVEQSSQTSNSVAREKSATETKTEDIRAGKAANTRVSINAALIAAYIDAYERGNRSRTPCQQGTDTKPIPYERQREAMATIDKEGDYVQPLSNPRAAFPVFDYANDPPVVRADGVNKRRESFVQLTVPPTINARNTLVRAYLFDFAYANAVLSLAADKLSLARVRDERDVVPAVEAALCSIDYSQAYLNAEAVVDEARCVGAPYPQPDGSGNGFDRPLVLDCGTIYINAEQRTVRIRGVNTLDQTMIDGRDVTVAISSDANVTESQALSKSKNTKTSTQTTKQNSPE